MDILNIENEYFSRRNDNEYWPQNADYYIHEWWDVIEN